MHREITRTKGDRFCTIEITLENGRLSICGTEGRIMRRTQAKKDALEYWTSYFDENPQARFSVAQTGTLPGSDRMGGIVRVAQGHVTFSREGSLRVASYASASQA